MTSVLAPVLPYLAEEIYAHRGIGASGRSFFTNKWESLVRPSTVCNVGSQSTRLQFLEF